jgi:hypothetical protein
MESNEAQEKVNSIVQEIFGQNLSNETKELIVSLVLKN